MNDYIKSETYYTVYWYSNEGNRLKIGTFSSKFKALEQARKYDNWQIEITQYLTNLPF